jgi:hypothetical protein
MTGPGTAADQAGRDGLSRAHTAREAARRGWAVFPCRPGDKRPAVPDWERKACSDPEAVARYWPSPEHNIGVACGPSGLVVLDLDCHGTLPEDWQAEPGINDGRDVLAALVEWAGQPWPCTYWVATPSGGWHLYFRAPAGAEIRNSAGKIGPMIDVRGAGGYVVGAGSVVGGRPYELLDGAGPVPLPRWLARLLAPRPEPTRPAAAKRDTSASARLAGLVQAVEAAAEGQRNSVLHWAACRAAEMVTAGQAGPEAVTADLVAAAAVAGLGEREARRTVASGLRGGAR